MKGLKQGSLVAAALFASLLLLAGGAVFAAEGDNAVPDPAAPKEHVKRNHEHGSPVKPSSEQLAKKREVVRNQQDQRVTNEKRKSAASALKEERMKVYRAKQAKKHAAEKAKETK